MANERSKNLFTQVPIKTPPRNLFDLSHEVKMSGKFGFLYPILLMDTLPGDRVRNTMNCMLRFAPLLAPIMHRVDVTTHFFFVPNRILWEQWEDFITGGQDGTLVPVPPYYTPAGITSGAAVEAMQKGSLWDYLGLPVHEGVGASTSVEKVSALPFYAVAKVFNDYYRDPNLNGVWSSSLENGEIPIPSELDGNVSANGDAQNILFGLSLESDYSYLRRAFEKDYFTSALPWAQRGAQVLIPLSVTVDHAQLTTGFVPGFSGNITTTAGGVLGNSGGAGVIELTGENVETTMNDFRRALAVQQWLEANARGGARYVEQIESHFSERVPDYRLQRAEYLGGGKQPVVISEVLATGGGSVGLGDAPVGEMSGHGLSVGRTNTFNYKCSEHGWVIGFLSVVPRTAYMQGIPKMWSRDDKFDYGWPELAHLGEQEIVSKEVFFDFAAAGDAANNGVFGYIPRYAEYKFMNDRVAGDFRDNLGFWHLTRKFTTRPALDVPFTTMYEDGEGFSPGEGSAEEETFRRIFAVQDGTDYLWMQLYHHLTAKRPLPYFGVPKII